MSTRGLSAASRIRRFLSGKSSESRHSRVRTTKLRLECLEPRLALSGLNVAFAVQNAHYSAANVYVTFIGGTLSATYDGGKAVALNHSYTLSQLKGPIHLTKYTGGRIYVSLGAGVAGVHPPEMTNPAIPSYHVRFDKIEITYDASDTGSCANLTAVDFSGIPLQLKTFKSGQQTDVLTYNIVYNTLKSDLGALTGNNSAVVLYDDVAKTKFLRLLAPHAQTITADYPSMQPYIDAVKVWQQTHTSTIIAGQYTGLAPYSTNATKAQSYHFEATIESDGSLKMVGGGSVVGQNHTILVPAASLADGIYLGNVPSWTVDGHADSFTSNNVYCAAFRDMLGGFNLGFVASSTIDPATGKAFGEEASSNWWKSAKAFDYLQSNPLYYNRYAQIITSNSSAYSWAFSDLWSHVQAKLHTVDTMRITVLPDFVLGGPTIGSVAVVPSKGYMSWNAQDTDGVASSTLQIDGVDVSRVNGPYKAAVGVYHSGVYGALSTGTHSYTITATDTLGNTSQKTGTFEAAPLTGPTIGSVVVVATKGLMTWNLQDRFGVASSTLKVDNVTVARIGGPYAAAAGVNYYGAYSEALSTGTHSYTITATDNLGNTSQKTGTFEAAPITGPTIDKVAVVANKGYMSWNAQDSLRVVSATLTVDGVAASRINGPFKAAAGVNFSGVFGDVSTGTHRYTITATDSLGYSSEKTGTFRADAITGPTIGSVVIVPERGEMTWNVQDLAGVAGTSLKIDSLAASRIYGPYKASAGVDYAGDFRILSGGVHSYAITATNALGYSTEKTGTFEVAGLRFDAGAPRDPAAANRVDLLTTVMHEMGHVLGLRG
jgi:hypothetical protein